MKKNDHPEREYQIYLPRTRELVPVTKEVYQAYYQPIWRIRDHARRHGQCGNTDWRFCDGDCATCRYRMAGDTMSLDYELNAASGGGFTLLDLIDDDSSDIEEYLARKVLEEQMHKILDELGEHDRIICLGLAAGKSERTIAHELGITQSTLSYRKRKLLARLARQQAELEGLL